MRNRLTNALDVQLPGLSVLFDFPHHAHNLAHLKTVLLCPPRPSFLFSSRPTETLHNRPRAIVHCVQNPPLSGAHANDQSQHLSSPARHIACVVQMFVAEHLKARQADQPRQPQGRNAVHAAQIARETAKVCLSERPWLCSSRSRTVDVVVVAIATDRAAATAAAARAGKHGGGHIVVSTG